MGEVYSAREHASSAPSPSKSCRALAADPEFRERFEREARAISSLNHPHICTLFDVGQQDGNDFLVMEYLDGETLAGRVSAAAGLPWIRRGAGDRVDICGALDMAHRHGIVHRDLKPANVMLTKAGAKLLDFGLAKTAAPAVAASGLAICRPGADLTAQGTILGTFHTWPPSRSRGSRPTRAGHLRVRRVLYEMLTGRRSFEGKTRASLIASISDEPAPISEVQPLTPPALGRIVSTCLEKDPDNRFQTAHEC